MDSLYLIQSDVTGAVKIGRSKDPIERLATLQTGAAYRLVMLASFEGQGCLEKSLHRDLSQYRLSGEWFKHQCLPELPAWMYEKLPFDDRWWLRRAI